MSKNDNAILVDSLISARYTYAFNNNIFFFIGNKKPAMKKVAVINFFSMGDCKKLCDAQTNCVLWWWRGSKCTTWNLFFGYGRNMASGSRQCCITKPDQDFHPPRRTLGGNFFPFLNLPSYVN